MAGGTVVCQQRLDVSFERRSGYLGAWDFAASRDDFERPGRVSCQEYTACEHGCNKTRNFDASTLSTNYCDNSYTTKRVVVLLENTPTVRVAGLGADPLGEAEKGFPLASPKAERVRLKRCCVCHENNVSQTLKKASWTD